VDGAEVRLPFAFLPRPICSPSRKRADPLIYSETISSLIGVAYFFLFLIYRNIHFIFTAHIFSLLYSRKRALVLTVMEAPALLSAMQPAKAVCPDGCIT
jgi:hypothetical protein